MKFKFFISFFLVFILSLTIASACDIGSRNSQGQYCNINGAWTSQLNDGIACQNNFECKSNLCENSVCTSESIIEKLIKQKYLLDQILNLLSAKECDNIGQRIGNQYCDTSYELQPQIPTGSSCTRDYECVTNNCENNLCKEITTIQVCTTGNRQNNQYCENNVWISQKTTTSTCANPYECITNLCQNNLCVECISNSNCPGKECKNNLCVAIITTDGTGITGGDGGSRGAGVRGQTSNSVTKHFDFIYPDELTYFKLNHEIIPVTEINFILNTLLRNIEFTIKKTDKSSNIPDPLGLVYMYFHLDPDKIEDKYIKEANIIFRVNKGWLEEKKVDKYSMILQRYTLKWNEVDTQIKSEDNVYVYYISKTPGFSWFAITSKEKQFIYKEKYIPREPAYTPECGNDIIDSDENCDNCPEDVACLASEKCSLGVCIPAKKISKLWFIIPPIVIILTVLVIFLLKKYKKPEEEPKFIRPMRTIRYIRR